MMIKKIIINNYEYDNKYIIESYPTNWDYTVNNYAKSHNLSTEDTQKFYESRRRLSVAITLLKQKRNFSTFSTFEDAREFRDFLVDLYNNVDRENKGIYIDKIKASNNNIKRFAKRLVELINEKIGYLMYIEENQKKKIEPLKIIFYGKRRLFSKFDTKENKVIFKEALINLEKEVNKTNYKEAIRELKFINYNNDDYSYMKPYYKKIIKIIRDKFEDYLEEL